jgi:polyribonucleotide nucleotidyltransferase
MAIVASAASLWVSDVPLAKPVAAVIVGRIGDEFVLNPTNEEMEKSSLNLVLAGTKDAVLMIEGAAEFLPEAVMMEAVTFGHEKGIKIICEAMEEFGKVVNVEKKTDTLVQKPAGLQERVNELMSAKVDDLFEIHDKKEHSAVTSQLSTEIVTLLEPEYPDTNPDLIRSAFKNLLQRKMYTKAKTTRTRVDGRKLDVVRPITIEPSLLPSVHGSSLFTRGETQAIATATLGDAGMRQKN